jgi:hypothetical protein
MNRSELVRRLADFATRPIAPDAETAAQPMHQPIADAAPPVLATVKPGAELFVWFEDTSTRNSRNGIAGLPESLLPYSKGMRVAERRYVEGHLHLLTAVRIRCADKFGEKIAAIYTAALSVGTIAWIGTGSQYERAWNEMYPYAASADSTPDFPSEI